MVFDCRRWITSVGWSWTNVRGYTERRQEHAVPTQKINYRMRRPLIPNRSLSPLTARVLGSKCVCHRGFHARKLGYVRALGYHTLRRLTLSARGVGIRKPFDGTYEVLQTVRKQLPFPNETNVASSW
jgi:hypothetical protein